MRIVGANDFTYICKTFISSSMAQRQSDTIKFTKIKNDQKFKISIHQRLFAHFFLSCSAGHHWRILDVPVNARPITLNTDAGSFENQIYSFQMCFIVSMVIEMLAHPTKSWPNSFVLYGEICKFFIVLSLDSIGY